MTLDLAKLRDVAAGAKGTRWMGVTHVGTFASTFDPLTVLALLDEIEKQVEWRVWAEAVIGGTWDPPAIVSARQAVEKKPTNPATARRRP